MLVDHVALLVPDVDAALAELGETHGLGSSGGSPLPLAGTTSYMIPLLPPAYVELHVIEDREAARATESGRRVLECEAAGFGYLGWAVLVDDLEAVSARLGIEIFDYTIPHADGTLRGWRAVSGPSRFPFFIDYPRNGDRSGRLRALYDRAEHRCSPRGFSELTIAGDEDEFRDWLGGGRDLPLRFVAGDDGLVEVKIETADGEVVV